jgi:hypothetical protein
LEVRRFREGKKVLEGQSYNRVEEAGTEKKDLDNLDSNSEFETEEGRTNRHYKEPDKTRRTKTRMTTAKRNSQTSTWITCESQPGSSMKENSLWSR